MLSKLGKTANPIGRRLDLQSLQVRLTVGIALVSALGIGSLAIWTHWEMEQQLVWTHKQSLKYIFDRFPRDVAHYSQRQPPETGLQLAIDHVTAENMVLWVKAPDGAISAKSMALRGRRDRADEVLMALPQGMVKPQLYRVNDRYWLWCSGELIVKGTNLGQLFIAQDITSDRLMVLALTCRLKIISLGAIVLMTMAIVRYVRRSLDPLRQLSQLTRSISAEDLTQVRMQWDNAPTEVQELAQTYNKMLDRLAESWENQRQFVSNASHELRTPLTIVSGYLQSTLRRGDNLSETQREALSIASGEADRTIQLLQDLLDLARADSGHLHFRLDPFWMNELVAEVVAMAQQYSNRQIEVDLNSGRIEVKGDRDRLKQVLLNLIDNAVKYSDSSTPITLKVIQQGDWVAIATIDRGWGIPLSQQARIFERFYRVDEARSRSTGGTGLGLSIVKTLVEGMGGTVSVRSTLGEGSAFTVSLPTGFNKSAI